MVRDFSNAKKEELYRALELIDDREWKPFMAWCGGRTAEFGEWADRLSISTYTRQVDNYQNRVLEVNDSTRNQMDITFEGVAETDRRYAQIFQGHAETVREQIRRVQTMLQVMQSANRNGTDIRTIAYGMNLHPDVSYMERLENGQRVLLNYLKVRGVTDPAKQQEICDWIMGNQMHMLEKLYEADCYGSVDAGTIYNSLMDCYNEYKRNKELNDAERLFDDYLISEEYTNSVEREFIVAAIQEMQPQLLLDWYHSDIYSTTNREEVEKSIEKYYLENKENIGLETIEERFRNDEKANQYSVVCEYLEFMVDLHYICKAEYDKFISDMGEGSDIGSDKKEELCEFMLERKEFIKAFERSKEMSNDVTDEKWTREQITCALQIEAELRENGYDDEFIAGLIGNMKKEGYFGVFEMVNKDGKKDGKDNKYWIHMMKCVDYFDVYNKKNVTDIDLIKLYVDLIYKKYEGDCEKTGEHKFGMGAIQWTNTRGEKLLLLYLKEAGYDTESIEFQRRIQNCLMSNEYKSVYLTEAQVRDAEMKMMVYELTEGDYTYVHSDYEKECGNDMLQNVKSATEKIMVEYIRPQNRISSEREAAALRWYEERRNNSTE